MRMSLPKVLAIRVSSARSEISNRGSGKQDIVSRRPFGSVLVKHPVRGLLPSQIGNGARWQNRWSQLSGVRLHYRHSTIYGQCLAHHVACRRAAKPKHGCGNLSGLPARWMGTLFAISCPFVPAHNIASNLGIDQSGIDGVHVNAFLDVFRGGGSRQTHNAMLRGDVRSDARITRQSTDRGIIDDFTAASPIHVAQFVFHRAPNPAQVDVDEPSGRCPDGSFPSDSGG